MIPAISTTLAESHVCRGHTIRGVICFSTSTVRNLTDFSISIGVEASLHTVVPTSSGIYSHADKVVYRDATLLKLPVATRARSFEVPFTYVVPPKCPVSTVYMDMAVLKTNIKTSIKDLSNGHDAPSITLTQVSVLPQTEVARSSSITKTVKKITYTAGAAIVPGTSYFVQLNYPGHYDITEYKMTLTTNLKISNGPGASFAKTTERPFPVPKAIHRKAPDHSNIKVLEVVMPTDLSYSVDVAGLCRSYSISIYLAPRNKTPVTLSFNVSIDNVSKDQYQALSTGTLDATSRPRTICRSELARPASTTTLPSPRRPDSYSFSTSPRTAPKPQVQTRPAPGPREPINSTSEPSKRISLTSKSLRQLTMGQLTRRALISDAANSTELAKSPTSIVSRTGSTSSNSSTSASDKAPFASPSSVASSVSEFQQRKQSLTETTVHVPSPVHSSPSPTKSTSNSSYSPKHKRQTSSFSIVSKRTSEFLSLSKLGRRSKSQKSFEISCCGPSDLPPPSALTTSTNKSKINADTYTFPRGEPQFLRATSTYKTLTTPTVDQSVSDPSSDEMPSTPGSCYSSMPSTPKLESNPFDSLPGSLSTTRKSVTIARRLSFKRPFHKETSTPYSFATPDKRFSISNCYLDEFDFEGLSSLDDEDAMSDDESIYGYELAAGTAI